MNKKELLKTVSQMEEQLIIDALEAYDWNITQSAKAIGVARSTMQRKMSDFGIKLRRTECKPKA